MNCTRCNKRLSRKTARQIDGEVMCSACMFAPREKRTWPFGGGTLESNIPGFQLLRGDKLRAAIMNLSDSDPLKQAVRDSGSGPKGENSRSEVEGEAPQSGLSED